MIYCLARLEPSMRFEWWEAAVIAAFPIPTVTGAVLGSGWKAKPADSGTKEGVPQGLH